MKEFEEVMEEINYIRTEYMEQHSDKSVYLYDFEDEAYIEDIEDICNENNIKYKLKNDGILIFKP